MTLIYVGLPTGKEAALESGVVKLFSNNGECGNISYRPTGMFFMYLYPEDEYTVDMSRLMTVGDVIYHGPADEDHLGMVERIRVMFPASFPEGAASIDELEDPFLWER